MTEMFGLLKELTTCRTPEKVLIREEAKFPVTKNVNSIYLARGEKERSDKADETPDNIKKPIGTEMEIPRFNDSRIGKIKGKTYNVSPKGPVYEAILRKKITRKEDIGGNFEIHCNIGGLKGINALVDQGSDVNVMPYTTYVKLTDERLAEIDVRLSLPSHLYIYPLGITEDVLVEAVIKFDKGTITLRSGNSKISFHRIPESLGTIKRGVKNDIEPIAPTMIVNRLVLEWEERIKLYLGKELYLMGRNLEVLRKFQWMILGRRFNQLSHDSSPLLSKPGEY
ncbi:hypothetical protein Tco_1571136 [Tanacetum coccineum]